MVRYDDVLNSSLNYTRAFTTLYDEMVTHASTLKLPISASIYTTLYNIAFFLSIINSALINQHHHLIMSIFTGLQMVDRLNLVLNYTLFFCSETEYVVHSTIGYQLDPETEVNRFLVCLEGISPQ